MKARLLLLTGLFLGLLALTACSGPGSGEQQLLEYRQRLAGGIDAELVAPASVPVPSIVGAGLTQIPIPEDQISLLDFLSLSGCELQVNLGRRNSNLGRNASPSQRLLLDLEFLRLAPRCITTIEDEEPDLARQLAELAAARQQALPALIYNALLAGPEWQAFWRLPSDLGDYPQSTSGDISDTLGQLMLMVERWLDGDWQADGMTFEVLLGDLREGDGGHLLRAASVQQQSLRAASRSLQDRIAQNSLCPYQSDTSHSRALRAVASRFFAGQVQPWLADLRRRETALMTSTRQLEQLLASVLPAEYQAWQTNRDAQLAALITEPRTHALQISDALDDCGGLRPGSASSSSGADDAR